VTTYIPFVAGVGVLPPDFSSFYQASDSNVLGKGNTFDWYELDDFNTLSTDQYGLTVQGNELRLNPLTPGIYFSYKRKAADMTLSTGSIPDLPSTFHETIIYGIVYRALEDLQDELDANIYEGKYERRIEQKSDTLSDLEETGQNSGVLFSDIRII
jgi:hypothetical protein